MRLVVRGVSRTAAGAPLVRDHAPAAENRSLHRPPRIAHEGAPQDRVDLGHLSFFSATPDLAGCALLTSWKFQVKRMHGIHRP